MELVVGLGFAAFFLVGVAAGLPVSVPTGINAGGLNMHFFGPLVFAALIQLGVTYLYGLLRRRHIAGENVDPFIMVKLFPLLVLAVFLYFNFKYWAHIIHPRLYDAELAALDQLAAPLLDAFRAIRSAVADRVGEAVVESWYMTLYVGMFFISLAVHGIFESTTNQRRLVLGLCFNLLLGGLSYWIMPALGPFIYAEGLNASSALMQQVMYQNHLDFLATGQVPGGAFTMALGAMPSLHVGHSFFFILWAARSSRGLLLFYLPIFVWIVIEAAATGWHYLADLPAGALLACVSFTLANRLVREPAAVGGPLAAKPADRASLDAAQQPAAD